MKMDLAPQVKSTDKMQVEVCELLALYSLIFLRN